MSKLKPLYFFIILFLFICLITPVYFIADDWEHLNWYHQDLPPFTLIQLFYRHTGLYIVHQIFFPVFAEGYFLLAKFISYLFLVGSGFLICDLFIKDFRKKILSSYSFALLPIFMVFAPNQYEWNYWPTNMTCISSLFLMILCFWGEKKYQYYILSFVKNVSYIFAGFTFESLIPLAVLLELSHIIYNEKRTFKGILQKILSRTMPFLVIFFIAKYKMNSFAPFPYDAKFGFKAHLFQQWLSLFFSHDYYKTRHLTGSLSVLSLSILIFYRWRLIDKKLLYRELFIVLAVVIGSSYYWMIQDYSSRRALGGQLYFFWGWVSIYLFSLLANYEKLSKPVKISALIFLISTLFHHGYVFKTKYHEKNMIIANADKAKNLLGKYNGSGYRFDPLFPRQGIGRAWNFIGVRQLNGFLRHYLSEDEINKINFEDASHHRIVPKPPF